MFLLKSYREDWGDGYSRLRNAEKGERLVQPLTRLVEAAVWTHNCVSVCDLECKQRSLFAEAFLQAAGEILEC